MTNILDMHSAHILNKLEGGYVCFSTTIKIKKVLGEERMIL